MWSTAQDRNFTLPQRLRVLPTANQSLANQNRKPMQVIANNHQRSKSVASFCRVFCGFKRKSCLCRAAGLGAPRPSLAVIAAPLAVSVHYSIFRRG
jgi:hypothetical protein